MPKGRRSEGVVSLEDEGIETKLRTALKVVDNLCKQQLCIPDCVSQQIFEQSLCSLSSSQLFIALQPRM